MRLESGDISKKDYDKKIKEAQEAYAEQMEKMYNDSAEFYIRTIKEAYPEVSTAMEKYIPMLQEQFSGQLEQGVQFDDMSEQFYVSATSIWENQEMEEVNAVQEELREIYGYGLKSNRQKMEELRQKEKDMGLKVSGGFNNENTEDIKMLSALSGDVNDTYEFLGKAISGDDGLSAVVIASEKAGGAVPEAVALGISNNSPRVLEAVDSLVGLAEKRAEEAGAGMKITITPDIVYGALPEYTPNPALTQLIQDSRPQNQIPKKTSKKGSTKKQKILSNATGGIYYDPILTTFAEEGPEAAIPLDGSSRAKTLWQEAGEILGMLPKGSRTFFDDMPSQGRDKALYEETLKLKPAAVGTSGSTQSVQINYSPVIEVKGNADQKTLTKVLRRSKEEFAEMMDAYLASKGRTLFAN